MDLEVDVDIDWYLGCSKEASKPIQVQLNGIEAVLALTLMF